MVKPHSPLGNGIYNPWPHPVIELHIKVCTDEHDYIRSLPIACHVAGAYLVAVIGLPIACHVAGAYLVAVIGYPTHSLSCCRCLSCGCDWLPYPQSVMLHVLILWLCE